MDKFSSVRRILLVIIVVSLVFSVLVWFVSPNAAATVRLCLTGGLCWFLYQGKNWARWIMGILFAIAAIYAWSVVLMLPLSIEKTVVLGVMAAFYSVAASLLFFSKMLAEYFKSEGGKPSES